MAKRGSKGKPAKIKVLQGTNRLCREAEVIAEALSVEPVKPVDLTDDASVIWDTEVKKLLLRGIALGGYELQLKTLCELTAKIDKLFANGLDVPGAWLTEQRRLCNEFHMTPASGIGRSGSGKKKNSFKELEEQTK